MATFNESYSALVNSNRNEPVCGSDAKVVHAEHFVLHG